MNVMLQYRPTSSSSGANRGRQGRAACLTLEWSASVLAWPDIFGMALTEDLNLNYMTTGVLY